MTTHDAAGLSQHQSEVLRGLIELVAVESLQLWKVVEVVAEQIASVLGDTCFVCLLSEDRGWVHPVGLADPDPEVDAALEVYAGDRWRADRGFTRYVLEARVAMRVLETSPEVVQVGRPELQDYLERFGITGLMLAPLRARGETYGHIAILRRRPDAPHTSEEERFVQAVADWLALAVQSVESPAEPVQVRSEEPPHDLSARERDVLRLLALGHTNRQIAEQLFLSVRTVEWHRARLQWKLEVRGRAALAKMARVHGLVD
jgi:DNA-binding CsgD family transcriptional regulator